MSYDRIKVFFCEPVGDNNFRNPNTGEVCKLSQMPPGACWDMTWWDEKGPDGRALCVKLPDGHTWRIDGRASNCTMPNDDKHYCWIRHGKPEDGTLHVDKNGYTCQAGAGSIQTPSWHGFLRNGYLVTC
jgi:hypothetical protein